MSRRCRTASSCGGQVGFAEDAWTQPATTGWRCWAQSRGWRQRRESRWWGWKRRTCRTRGSPRTSRGWLTDGDRDRRPRGGREVERGQGGGRGARLHVFGFGRHVPLGGARRDEGRTSPGGDRTTGADRALRRARRAQWRGRDRVDPRPAGLGGRVAGGRRSVCSASDGGHAAAAALGG